MPVEPKRVQAVFLMAVEHQEPANRAAVLDRECATDLELRQRVLALLRSHDEPDRFLDQPIVRPTPPSWANLARSDGAAEFDPVADLTLGVTPAPPGESPPRVTAKWAASNPMTEGAGSCIGPYKLLQKIGEGGMGAVYMAEQEHPVRRWVALKIIKPGMDSEQVIARFEAERQALALMDHQNIARVLDVGTTESGRPFFVMELVHGVSITEYCDQSQLTTRERLELFIPVCQAIQHAHQNGIIHRDIKPSNVLVTLYDGKPVAKVIDFGVAKAIEQRLTTRTLFTQYGSIVGTYEYMSPEQAEMSALGVDTRSDIYSLGVVLYELLTGTTPLDREKTIGSTHADILRRIREEEPPKPSTRLKGSKDALPLISAQRKSEPQRLTKLMRGELDWIVMKALEKDRTRRYQTASDFGRDVERYLKGDVVEACPPSASYRLRKIARKNRAALVTVGSFAVLLPVGAALSSLQAIRATRAEAVAVSQAKRALIAEEQSRIERDRAVAAEAQAKGESEKAERSAAEARAVLGFFQDQVLSAARPEGLEGGLGKDVTMRTVVEVAEPKIAGAFADQPTTEASIRSVLGETYYYLGEPALAVRQRERALELRTARLGPDHPDTLESQNSLALAYWAAGQYDRAILLLERTLAARSAKLGPDHPDTLISQSSLANAYRSAGRLDQSIPLFERALAVQTAKLGPDHLDTLNSQNSLAVTYWIAGQNHRAIPMLERTLAMLKAKLGLDHVRTLVTQSSLANAYRDAGQLDRSIALFERTLAAQTAMLGPDHPDSLTSQNNLAKAYRDAGQLDRAIPLLERTAAMRTVRLGLDHPNTLTTRFDLGDAYRARGDFARAESLFRDVLVARQKTLGAGHQDVAQALSALGRSLLEQRKWAEAEPLLREGLAIWDARHPDAWNRFSSQSLLGNSLLGQQKYAEAEPLLLSGFEGMNSRETRLPASKNRYLAEAGERIVRLYEAWGKSEDARAWRAKLIPPPTQAKPVSSNPGPSRDCVR
jgi:serine/threonine protein kinase/tetratricopeptide (TPR) repeat protein